MHTRVVDYYRQRGSLLKRIHTTSQAFGATVAFILRFLGRDRRSLPHSKGPMFRLRPQFMAAMALLVVLPASASADVIITSAIRRAQACVAFTDFTGNTDLTCDSSSTSSAGAWAASHAATDVDTFGVMEATADQTSLMAANVAGVTNFGGTFDASAAIVPTNPRGILEAIGANYYQVDFTLTETYEYEIGGVGAATSTDSQTIGGFSVVLYGGHSGIFVLQGMGNTTDVLVQSGILAPGDYILESSMLAKALLSGPFLGGVSTAASSFDLALTPVALQSVPEPTAMLFLGTGLLSVGVRRWRSQRA